MGGDKITTASKLVARCQGVTRKGELELVRCTWSEKEKANTMGNNWAVRKVLKMAAKYGLVVVFDSAEKEEYNGRFQYGSYRARYQTVPISTAMAFQDQEEREETSKWVNRWRPYVDWNGYSSTDKLCKDYKLIESDAKWDEFQAYLMINPVEMVVDPLEESEEYETESSGEETQSDH